MPPVASTTVLDRRRRCSRVGEVQLQHLERRRRARRRPPPARRCAAARSRTVANTRKPSAGELQRGLQAQAGRAARDQHGVARAPRPAGSCRASALHRPTAVVAARHRAGRRGGRRPPPAARAGRSAPTRCAAAGSAATFGRCPRRYSNVSRNAELLGVHEHHRRPDLGDPLQRQRADAAVVLRQRGLLEQPQHRPRVARQAAAAVPTAWAGRSSRGSGSAGRSACSGGHGVTRALQRRDPVGPADPVVVGARSAPAPAARASIAIDLAHPLGVVGREVQRDVGAVAVPDTTGRSISSASSRSSRSAAMSSGL